MTKKSNAWYLQIAAFLILTLVFPVWLAPAAATSAAPAAQPTPAKKIDQTNSVDEIVLDGQPAAKQPIPADAGNAILIELTDKPAVEVYLEAKQEAVSRNAVDAELQATQLTQQHLNKIEATQQTVLNNLRTIAPKLQVLYTVQRTLNGIAAYSNGSNLEQIKALPGVKEISALPRHYISNAASVPLIGAPAAWGYSTPYSGTNVKIGIIDTGIDYIHTGFGGSGLDYSTTSTTTLVPNVFPSAKVAGGFDFSGDNYNGYNTPQSDPNPMDCNGHGSHVAGTAAGFGVNLNGTTYTGPWDNTTNFSNFSVGPGVAPGATLYGLRVFGCGGSTTLVLEAIEWASDPNHDGDFSDHLDVINMSLGSDLGTGDDRSATASENAAALGIIVVAAAGNASDVYYVTGSPANSPRTISVAGTTDAGDKANGVATSKTISGTNLFAISSANYGPSLGQLMTTTLPLVYPAQFLGCDPFDTNDAALMNGKAVLIDRGVCGFAVKVANAQNAGAQAVLIANNGGQFGNLGGTPTQTLTIFSGMIQTDIGAAFKSNLPMNITLSPLNVNAVTSLTPAQVDQVYGSTSRGPSVVNNALKPDVAAPGVTIFSVATGTGNKGSSKSGTSMATPHIAGVMAILKQRYPNWTVEELKALVMNTANNNVYTGLNKTGFRLPPQRVGSGRVDTGLAVTNTVIAYNANEPGVVNLSFGALEVTSTLVLTKTVKVANKGNTSASYTISYDPYSTVPGVTYSLPDGSSLQIAGNSQETFRVQISVDASLLKHTRDQTASANSALSVNGVPIPRPWLAEASGLVLLTPTLNTQSVLRVPVYTNVRPAAVLNSTTSPINASAPTSSFTVTLSGQGVKTGSTYPTDTVSLVAPFELVASNPQTITAKAQSANIRYLGVSTNKTDFIHFGIATWGQWATAADESQVTIYLDTDNDGVDDYKVVNIHYTNSNLVYPSDVQVATIYDKNAVVQSDNEIDFSGLNLINPARLDTALANNNVLIMPVSLKNLPKKPTGKLTWRVETKTSRIQNASEQAQIVDRLGPFVYDFTKPGLDFNLAGNPLNSSVVDYLNAAVASPIFTAENGTTLPVSYNQSNFTANGARGLLLFHPFNLYGNRTEVFNICIAPFGVTTNSDASECGSLRYALEQANKVVATDPVTITVQSSGILTLSQPLPEISGTTPIVLAGSCINPLTLTPAAGTGVNTGLKVTSNGHKLTGLRFEGFSTAAIQVTGSNNNLSCISVTGGGDGIVLATATGPGNNHITDSSLNPATGVGIVAYKGSGNTVSSSIIKKIKVWVGGQLIVSPNNKVTAS